LDWLLVIMFHPLSFFILLCQGLRLSNRSVLHQSPLSLPGWAILQINRMTQEMGERKQAVRIDV
jgi:hypothetical protein